MAGYTRVDTINNIADGNVINAADLDGEFDGVQSAFNASTGHNHDGTAGEGAPILALGPTQNVTISASVLGVATTNTVDLGTSSLKFKDFYLAGNASIGGTLGVTGATTLSAALTYGGVTLSNAVTGTGNMVLSASPTLTGTAGFANITASGTLNVTGVATLGNGAILGTPASGTVTNLTGTASININGTVGATTATTGAFTTLSATGVTTVQAGTAALPAITTTGDTNTGIFFPAADTIAFSEGGVEAARIDSSGNVGIGTASPSTKLDVAGNIFATGFGRFAGSLGFFGKASDLVSGGSASDTGLRYDGNNLVFSYSNTERMRLDSSGNLGLGVTPSTSTIVQFEGGSNFILTGRGNVYLGNNVTFNSSFKYIATATAAQYNISGAEHRWNIAPSGTAGNAITFTQAMTLNSSGNLYLGAISSALANENILTGGQGGGIQLIRNVSAAPTSGQSLGSYAWKGADSANSNAAAEAMIEAVAAENFSGIAAGTNMLFYTKAIGTGPGSSPSERMRIDSSGNVGIGNTPTAKLDVTTGDGTATANAVYFRGTTGVFAIYPFFDANNGVLINSYNAAISAYKPMVFQASNWGWNVNGTRKMDLDSSGNLLVGTTSTSGSVSNLASVLGGTFKSFAGSVATTSGTAATLFTAPTAFSSYLITVWINADDVANYQLVAIVSTQPGGSVKITTIVSASLLAVSVSGYNVQATQTSGAAATVNYHAIRIAG